MPYQMALFESFQKIRKTTADLCAPLLSEDMVVQTMDQVSPTKWHLAHTTWFFETFVLREALPEYRSPHSEYATLFNSYYNTVGAQFPRSKRGWLSRPSVEEVNAYRRQVDNILLELLLSEDERLKKLMDVVEIGLHHEQQHQELILTDIKHVFSTNPLYPVYAELKAAFVPSAPLPSLGWIEYPEGLYWIGYEAKASSYNWAYDHEKPKHRVFLNSFKLASRLVSNAEYLEFMKDGGYQRHELWLSDGWDRVCAEDWFAPLYWFKRDDEWWSYTLAGARKVEPNLPVVHVSYFEADAYARWAGARLSTEAEWEVAGASVPLSGNFQESHNFHPVVLAANIFSDVPAQMFGDVWEWTQSAYGPYPGYQLPAKALGEYNAKFMCNQFVLRGGSCATPQSHMRLTYRNFFHPQARWQFSGIRLAKDA